MGAVEVAFTAGEKAPEPRRVRLDTEALYVAIDRRRRAHGLSNRAVLREVGEHSPSSLRRLGQGVVPSADQLVRWLHWLGETDLAPYIARVEGEVSQDA